MGESRLAERPTPGNHTRAAVPLLATPRRRRAPSRRRGGRRRGPMTLAQPLRRYKRCALRRRCRIRLLQGNASQSATGLTDFRMRLKNNDASAHVRPSAIPTGRSRSVRPAAGAAPASDRKSKSPSIGPGHVWAGRTRHSPAGPRHLGAHCREPRRDLLVGQVGDDASRCSGTFRARSCPRPGRSRAALLAAASGWCKHHRPWAVPGHPEASEIRDHRRSPCSSRRQLPDLGHPRIAPRPTFSSTITQVSSGMKRLVVDLAL